MLRMCEPVKANLCPSAEGVHEFIDVQTAETTGRKQFGEIIDFLARDWRKTDRGDCWCVYNAYTRAVRLWCNTEHWEGDNNGCEGIHKRGRELHSSRHVSGDGEIAEA